MGVAHEHSVVACLCIFFLLVCFSFTDSSISSRAGKEQVAIVKSHSSLLSQRHKLEPDCAIETIDCCRRSCNPVIILHNLRVISHSALHCTIGLAYINCDRARTGWAAWGGDGVHHLRASTAEPRQP